MAYKFEVFLQFVPICSIVWFPIFNIFGPMSKLLSENGCRDINQTRWLIFFIHPVSKGEQRLTKENKVNKVEKNKKFENI